MTGESNMQKISTLILAGYRPYRAKDMSVGVGAANRLVASYRLVPDLGTPARMVTLWREPAEGHAMLSTPLDPEFQNWEPIEWTDIPFGSWEGLHVNLIATLVKECDEARGKI